jgi:CheY-like chemotaxis protein
MNWPNENSEDPMHSRGLNVTERPSSTAPYRRGGLRVFSLDKDSYTSGQAARLLGIPSRTLRRYLSIGKIEGLQNPITQTWQITSESLVKFISKQGGEAVVEMKEVSVLIFDDKKAVGDLFRRMAKSSRRPLVVSEFQEVGDALIESGVHRPDLIVIDTETPIYDGLSLLKLLCSNPHTQAAKILAMTDEPDKTRDLELLGAATTLVKPFSYADLVQTLEYMFPNTAELPS